MLPLSEWWWDSHACLIPRLSNCKVYWIHYCNLNFLQPPDFSFETGHSTDFDVLPRQYTPKPISTIWICGLCSSPENPQEPNQGSGQGRARDGGSLCGAANRTWGEKHCQSCGSCGDSKAGWSRAFNAVHGRFPEQTNPKANVALKHSSYLLGIRWLGTHFCKAWTICMHSGLKFAPCVFVEYKQPAMYEQGKSAELGKVFVYIKTVGTFCVSLFSLQLSVPCILMEICWTFFLLRELLLWHFAWISLTKIQSLQHVVELQLKCMLRMIFPVHSVPVCLYWGTWEERWVLSPICRHPGACL